MTYTHDHELAQALRTNPEDPDAIRAAIDRGWVLATLRGGPNEGTTIWALPENGEPAHEITTGTGARYLRSHINAAPALPDTYQYLSRVEWWAYTHAA